MQDLQRVLTQYILLSLLASFCIVAVSGLQPTQLGTFAKSDIGDNDTPFGHPGDFDVYIFAQTWAPEYCCENPGSRECNANFAAVNGNEKGRSKATVHKHATPVPDFWGATHLTLHGLWPQYNYSRDGHYWPQFCTKATLKEEVVVKFKPKWETYAPAYLLKEYLLPKHEWSKHGTCSGLEQLDYFMSSLSLIMQYSTPSILMNNIGRKINRTEIEEAYGGANQVALGCSDEGALQQVVTCFTKGTSGRLDGRARACPKDVLHRTDDNSCGETVFIRRVGDC